MRVKFISEIFAKDVKPRSGRSKIEFEYEYEISEKRVWDLNKIIDNTRDILDGIGYKDKELAIKKISIRN